MPPLTYQLGEIVAYYPGARRDMIGYPAIVTVVPREESRIYTICVFRPTETQFRRVHENDLSPSIDLWDTTGLDGMVGSEVLDFENDDDGNDFGRDEEFGDDYDETDADEDDPAEHDDADEDEGEAA